MITTHASERCRERACIFPASESGSGLCLVHERQEREPDPFGSLQPTWFILHRSPGPDELDVLRRQSRDRYRLAAQSKAFQQGRM